MRCGGLVSGAFSVCLKGTEGLFKHCIGFLRDKVNGYRLGTLKCSMQGDLIFFKEDNAEYSVR